MNTYLLLHNDFRIGQVISPRVDVLAWGEGQYMYIYTPTFGLIIKPMRKSSRNDISLINHKMGIYKIDMFII
jgi:hypothetical protein